MGTVMRRALGTAGLVAAVVLGVWAGPAPGAGRMAGLVAGALLLGGVVALAGRLWAWAAAAALLATSGLQGEGADALLRGAESRAVFLAMAGELAVLAAVWIGVVVAVARLADRDGARLLRRLDWPTVGGALIAAAVGGGVGFLLLRDPDPQQAVGGLIVAFAVAGLAGRTAFAEGGDLGIVAAPMLVGLAGYLGGYLTYVDMSAAQADLYRRALAPWVMALPLHYIGAGTLGAVLGIAWARSLAGPEAAGGHEAQTRRAAAEAGETA